MYSSIEQVRAVLAADQDDAGGSGAVLSNEAIEQNLIDASNQIDGIIRGIYRVPLDPVDPIVVTVARDIAAWLCDLTFRQWREQDERHPVALRYARAQEQLKQISRGTLILSDQKAAAEEQVSADGDIVAVYPDETGSDLFCAGDYFGPVHRRG